MKKIIFAMLIISSNAFGANVTPFNVPYVCSGGNTPQLCNSNFTTDGTNLIMGAGGKFQGTATAVSTINGLVAAGSNVTLTGSGTTASPYTISSTASGSGNVSSGTIGREAVYTGTTQVGSGVITDNGTNVGIGTSTALTSALVVNGGIATLASGASVFNNGNVGIGSASPGTILDVQGSIRATGFVLSASPTSGYVLTSSANGTGSWQAATGGSSQWTGTTGSTPVTIVGSNVGIGTSSAGKALAVGSTGQFTVDASGNSTTSGNSVAANFNFPSGNGWYQQNFAALYNNGAATIENIYGSGSEYIQLIGGAAANTHLILQPSGATSTTGYVAILGNNGTVPDAYFMDSGNVGMGSPNPGATLDVLGTVKLTSGTTGAVLCLTAGKTVGHCTSAASCTSTCTCTCAVN